MSFLTTSEKAKMDYAAHVGCVDDVKKVLNGKRKGPPSDYAEAIMHAASNGDLTLLDLLLQNSNGTTSGSHALAFAASRGDIEITRRLLQEAGFNDADFCTDALHAAAAGGHAAVVDWLIQCTSADPANDDNRPIRQAATEGRVAVVDRLLQDPRVDPSARQNAAIMWAAVHTKHAVVARLMQDPRVDPTDRDNFLVRRSIDSGDIALLELLLDDPRVDVNLAIRLSIPRNLRWFECRGRLTDICIAMQDMQLPAWCTVKILEAARPWSTLPLHGKWAIACKVKHFK